MLVVILFLGYNLALVTEHRIHDETAMQELGARIAGLLRGGEIIELIGDVGAGKTTLTRSILRTAGITDTIQSPTFTICNRYEKDGLYFAHYDFYRLGEAGIMEDEFVETAGDPHTVTIVEWGEIVSNAMPDDRLTIELIADTEGSREVTITGHGKLKALEEQLA